MKFNLVPKIILFVLLISGVGVGGLAYLSFINARELLQEQALLRLEEDVNKEAAVLMEALNQTQSDMIFLAESDAVKGIFRAIEGEGYDDLENATIAIWLGRLEKVFYTTIKQRPDYYSIRLIGIRDDGKELVRINRRNEEINFIREENLQSKSHRPYFNKTIKLQEEDFYISEVSLNREHGVLEKPYLPVFRMATPILSEDGNILGLVVINVKFDVFTHSLRQAPENISYFLAKSDGEYLYHTDESKGSKFDFKKGDSLENDFGDVDFFMDDSDQRDVDEARSVNLPNMSSGIAFNHIHFDLLDRERKFILGAVATYKVINEKSAVLHHKLLILAIAVIGAVSLLLSLVTHYLLFPIKKFTDISNRIAKGHTDIEIPEFGNDEIGDLARAFKYMIDANNNAYREIKKSKEVIENLVDGIITINEEGIVTGFTQAAAEIFGYEAKEVVGKNISMLMPESYVTKHDYYLQRYKKTGEKTTIGLTREVVGLRKDGSEFPVELSVGQSEIDGKSIFIGSVRDITVQKRAADELRLAKEDAEQAAIAKGDFLTRMSHEIRTPMNGIIGTASLIEDTELSEKQRHYIYTIKSSGQSLLTILNEILDFSSLEAGKIEVIAEPFDLYYCLDKIYHLFQAPVQEKGLEFNLEYEGVSQYIVGDQGRIRQVVINFLNNAMKFTDNGSIALKVALLDQGDDKQALKFSVQDTGNGIPEDKFQDLFQAFSQVDTSSVRKTGGTGLGLSICKALVEIMGGEIGVESIEGKGSVFWFTLPLVISSEENLQEISQQYPATEEKPVRSKYDASVLLVEDVEVNRFVITEILESYGCDIEHAGNGKLAVGMAAKKSYDIIFMDCQMPVMDGFESTREIRKIDKDVPIIALTANVLTSEKEKCFESGMNDFVPKPITKEDFAPILNEWVPDLAVGCKDNEAKEEDKLLPETGDSPIDFQVLEQFGKNTSKIIELTLKDADNFMGNIEQAMKQKNSEEFGLESHSLKSVAAQVGAVKLSEIAKELERKGKGNEMEDVTVLFSALQSEYELVKQALLKYTKKAL